MSISNRIGDIASGVYERLLLEEINKRPKPLHVGIITDGNRRFAKKTGINPNDGHVKGKDKLEEVLQWCMDLGIRIVTVYGFSTENFKRNRKEVTFLFRLFDRSLKDLMKDERVIRNGIKVTVIGEISLLPEYLKKTISETEKFTSRFTKFRLNLALGYGGREEIIDGIKKLVKDVVDGKVGIDDISEDSFRNYLYDSSLPDPDLILRTSGEERVSNFLLWQSAYSELYFSDVNWPDLRKLDFLRAIHAYQSRERRFGS